MIKWVLFALLCLIWGSSFVLMKTSLESLSAFQVASIRILFTGLVMLPLLPKALKTVPKPMIKSVIISGLLGSFFPAFLFSIAQTKIDSSLAGILNSLTPIFTVAIGTMFFKLRISWIKWAGMLTGFGGIMVLLLGNAEGISLDYIGYAFFVILATIFYGLNVNVVNQLLRNTQPLHVATIAFTSLIIPTLLILVFSGYFTDPNLINGNWTQGTIAAATLGILGTGVGSVLFYSLVSKAGPVFASTVTYGIPFVAIGWGLIYGEQITAIQIAGMVVILIGVRLANK
jgi:drug/metabolite transporter (DMT)-like permease